MNVALHLLFATCLTFTGSAFAQGDVTPGVTTGVNTDAEPIADGSVPAELMVPPDDQSTASSAKPAPSAPAVLVAPEIAAAAPPPPAIPAYPTRVCFAPAEACGKQLTKLLNSANKSLDIAIYHANDEKIAKRIALKAKKIAVRIVTDERQAKTDHSSIPQLAAAGVDVRYGKQRGIFHDQFVIVDGVRVEMGSFNFTRHAFNENQENQIYTSEPAVIERYQKQFEKIWATARPVRKSSPVAVDRVAARPEPARAVASEPPAKVKKSGRAAKAGAPAPPVVTLPAMPANADPGPPATAAPAAPASEPKGDW